MEDMMKACALESGRRLAVGKMSSRLQARALGGYLSQVYLFTTWAPSFQGMCSGLRSLVSDSQAALPFHSEPSALNPQP